MAVRWYLMPAAVSPEGRRAPKYFYSRRAKPSTTKTGNLKKYKKTEVRNRSTIAVPEEVIK